MPEEPKRDNVGGTVRGIEIPSRAAGSPEEPFIYRPSDAGRQRSRRVVQGGTSYGHGTNQRGVRDREGEEEGTPPGSGQGHERRSVHERPQHAPRGHLLGRVPRRPHEAQAPSLRIRGLHEDHEAGALRSTRPFTRSPPAPVRNRGTPSSPGAAPRRSPRTAAEPQGSPRVRAGRAPRGRTRTARRQS